MECHSPGTEYTQVRPVFTWARLVCLEKISGPPHACHVGRLSSRAPHDKSCAKNKAQLGCEICRGHCEICLRQKSEPEQLPAPVLVIISGKSLAFSRKIIASTGFYRYCAPDASAPVVVINWSLKNRCLKSQKNKFQTISCQIYTKSCIRFRMECALH